MYRLSIEGSAMEGKVHLLICPDGRTEPLIELYLSDDMSVINETMLYSAIRGNLTEKLGPAPAPARSCIRSRSSPWP